MTYSNLSLLSLLLQILYNSSHFYQLNSSCRPFPLLLPPSLTSFCHSIFRVHSNTLFPSACPPSQAVPLTYFMAHRQRQECLLLSVVSRSVGQRRRMRASFPSAFVSPSNPPLLPLQVFMNIIQGWGRGVWWGGTEPTFFHICWWLCPNPFLFTIAILQFFEKKRQTRHSKTLALPLKGKFKLKKRKKSLAACLDVAPGLQHNRPG